MGSPVHGAGCVMAQIIRFPSNQNQHYEDDYRNLYFALRSTVKEYRTVNKQFLDTGSFALAEQLTNLERAVDAQIED